MTNLDRVLKSKDITLPTKFHLVKAMIFPVVMYRCESWTIKKAEHWRIDAFEIWCWRRLLRVPWTARRSNQPIWKETNSEYSLEGLMLKLKLQYFGHLIRRADSLEKNPNAGKDWGQEEKEVTENEMVGWHHQLKGHELEQTPRDSEGQVAWRATVHGAAKSQTQLSGWTTTKDPLEEEMATHSSILAWKTPWTEEPGGLRSTGSQRVGCDWVT